MAKITVLDPNTVNQIAAGEVIERPASVVKELLENAIDAQATAVTVEIKDGGTTLIRITDNGSGITKEDIRLAFLPHATSKIRSAEDLITVASLGFRGEALASIASVSQVEVITKTAEEMTGIRYRIDGGEEKAFEEVGAPEGTTFLIRNLFFNTPARRKFLKTPAAEATHIGELVERIALSHPDVSIRFINNNQNKLHTSGNHNLKDIIYTIYGREIAANLLPAESDAGFVRVSGFIGKPVIARGNRNYENYFINGRYVKSGLISKAIEEAYGNYMMHHKYPFTVLYLKIEPELMDVNVHPTKMELRFRESEQIFRAVFHAVKDALAQKELIPEISLADQKDETKKVIPKLPRPEPFEKNRLAGMSKPADSGPTDRPEPPVTAVRERSDYMTAPLKSSETPSLGSLAASPEEMEPIRKQVRQTDLNPAKEKEPEQMDLFEDKLLSPKAAAEHRLIGQVFDTYWMVQYKDQLFIIDQHAAHEKVLYEKIMASMNKREFTSQRISPPIVLTLGMKEELLLKEYMAYFNEIGFEIAPFGGREYAVSAVPDNLFGIAKKDLLMELIDGLTEDLGTKGSQLISERIASMSCKAAVKGNNRLSPEEAKALIDQLMELENPYNCPHGRPTIITMSKYEMEKKFKRIL